MTDTIYNLIEGNNNDSQSCGIYQNNDGTYTAMTFTSSKEFKTYKGAVRWLERRIG